MKISILGAGTWGMALASLLVKNDHDVTVWSALPQEIDDLRATGKQKNLPGIILPQEIKYTKELPEACRGAEFIIYVVPSAFMRTTAKLSAPYLEEGVIISSASKGIEKGTLKTMTEIIE